MSSYHKLTKEDGSELTAQEAYEAAMQGPCYIILKYNDSSPQKLSAEIKPLEVAPYDGDRYYAISLFLTDFVKSGDTVTSVLFACADKYYDDIYLYVGEDIYGGVVS